MKRSKIKWKLLLFDESDFFVSFEASFFLFSFNRAMLFILSQIKKRVFFLNQTRLSNGQASNERIIYAKLKISGSHR